MINEEILRETGLTDYEVKIYLGLLRYGQVSAYVLAEKTGLYRQAVYDALNRLLEKGFVNTVKEGKSHKYKAIDPRLVLEYLEARTDNFNHILPDLVKLQKKAESQVVVETYKGKNAVRIGLNDIINHLKGAKGENLCTSVAERYFYKEYETVLDQYERDLLRFGIKEKVLIKEGDEGVFQKGSTEYRTISKNLFNPNPTQIYGDNVHMMILGEPDHLIIIRSKEIADAYRKQFEVLWRAAKK